ncbi:MAG: ATP-binding protein, partial [Gemmatimonadota bacterium]|nr:ATP-binding protein [Gemmatimonadota bacterium]
GGGGGGTPLDSAMANRLRNATQTDVTLVVNDSAVATTLPDSLMRELRALPDLLTVRNVRRVTLAGNEHLLALYPVPARGAPAAVLLSRPVGNELRVVRGIQQSLIGIGLAALVLALLLAGFAARIVARPAQILAEASIQLARGDFRAPLPANSGDEIGQLTVAFGEMRSAIAEREVRLRSAQAELIHREKLAAMGRLVAQLSHEINNPIYNIQNCLEALARRGDPADPNREFLELAQEELARMATLTRQLLDQGRPPPDSAAPLDLNGVVKRVVQLAAADLASGDVEPRMQLETELPPVVAHPDAIQQVLANLVNNAIDAMPDGGVLEIRTRADEEAVAVSVRDTGTGIPEEHLPQIFDAFYTTKPGVSGIGLGLFVSEGIIRGHRGTLAVQSTPGEGSCFTVRLPRETLDPAFSGDSVPLGSPASV